MIHLTKQLAARLAPSHITVNTAAFGRYDRYVFCSIVSINSIDSITPGIGIGIGFVFLIFYFSGDLPHPEK